MLHEKNKHTFLKVALINWIEFSSSLIPFTAGPSFFTYLCKKQKQSKRDLEDEAALGIQGF